MLDPDLRNAPNASKDNFRKKLALKIVRTVQEALSIPCGERKSYPTARLVPRVVSIHSWVPAFVTLVQGELIKTEPDRRAASLARLEHSLQLLEQ